jgi:hypothetical protein
LPVRVGIRLRLLVCGLLIALALAGCGGGRTGTAAEHGETAPGMRGPTSSRSSSTSRTATKLCQGQVGGFLGSMDSLRRRLVVGLAYEQYVDEVEAVRAAYRRIPADELRIDCLTGVGTPAEKGFNQYIDAANDWGECVGEAGCESATVEPLLQRRWRIASGLLSRAHRGLRDLGAS